MTASTGSRGTERRSGVGRPAHLSVWLDGGRALDVAPVSDDGRLVEGFDIAEWVDDIRLGYPSAVLAATFPGAAEGASEPGGPDEVPDDWQVWISRAARLVERTTEDLDEATSFRGDTTPTSLRSLRRWVAARLEAHPEVRDDAVLVVSELATNVERHAPSWSAIDLVVLDRVVLVGVTDPVVDQIPQPRTVTIEQASGRGLLVVANLSQAWGVVVRPDSKTVWSVLALGR
jgi:anti-sigma regulatory factor (Ser/Thr protein kinase)